MYDRGHRPESRRDSAGEWDEVRSLVLERMRLRVPCGCGRTVVAEMPKRTAIWSALHPLAAMVATSASMSAAACGMRRAFLGDYLGRLSGRWAVGRRIARSARSEMEEYREIPGRSSNRLEQYPRGSSRPPLRRP